MPNAVDASDKVVGGSESLAVGEEGSFPEVVHDVEEYVEDDEAVEELAEEIDEGEGDVKGLAVVGHVLPLNSADPHGDDVDEEGSIEEEEEEGDDEDDDGDGHFGCLAEENGPDPDVSSDDDAIDSRPQCGDE